MDHINSNQYIIPVYRTPVYHTSISYQYIIPVYHTSISYQYVIPVYHTSISYTSISYQYTTTSIISYQYIIPVYHTSISYQYIIPVYHTSTSIISHHTTHQSMHACTIKLQVVLRVSATNEKYWPLSLHHNNSTSVPGTS